MTDGAGEVREVNIGGEQPEIIISVEVEPDGEIKTVHVDCTGLREPEQVASFFSDLSGYITGNGYQIIDKDGVTVVDPKDD